MRVCNTCQGTGIVKGLHNWGSGGTREEKCWNCHEVEAQQPAPSAAEPDGRCAHYLPCECAPEAREGCVSWRKRKPSPTPQADSQPAPDPADIIAGALQISRGHAIELMRQAVDADRAARAPADSQPAVGTIAHVGTGKTTLTGAIASALRAASATADSVTAPAGEGVVTDGMVLAALRVQYPAAYGQYLRHPANGPKTSLRTESEIDTARRMIVAALSVAPTPPAQAAESVLEDAARYRWLRNPTTDVALVLDKRTGYVPVDEQVPSVGGYYTYEYRSGDELDAAVDAARKQGGAT